MFSKSSRYATGHYSKIRKNIARRINFEDKVQRNWFGDKNRTIITAKNWFNIENRGQKINISRKFEGTYLDH